MKPALILSLLTFLISANFSSTTYAETFDSETIKLWEALEDKFETADSLKGALAFYDEHLAHIEVEEVIPEAMGEGKYVKARDCCSAIFFNLALAAYVSGDARYSQFKDHAESVSEMLMESKDQRYQTSGVNAHNFFVRSAHYLGEYELAVQVLDESDRRIEKHFADFKRPKSLGKFDPTRNRTGEQIRFRKLSGFLRQGIEQSNFSRRRGILRSLPELLR